VVEEKKERSSKTDTVGRQICSNKRVFTKIRDKVRVLAGHNGEREKRRKGDALRLAFPLDRDVKKGNPRRDLFIPCRSSKYESRSLR